MRVTSNPCFSKRPFSFATHRPAWVPDIEPHPTFNLSDPAPSNISRLAPSPKTSARIATAILYRTIGFSFFEKRLECRLSFQPRFPERFLSALGLNIFGCTLAGDASKNHATEGVGSGMPNCLFSLCSLCPHSCRHPINFLAILSVV